MGDPPRPVQTLPDLFRDYAEQQRARAQAQADARRSRAADVAGHLFIKGEGDRSSVDGSDPIQQGGRNDCFLIAAMTAVAAAHPDPDRWLREAIHANADGTFDVTLYKNGAPVAINISPADISRPSESNDAGEMWPAVLELAYARAFPNTQDRASNDNASYGLISGGDPGQAMAVLTGQKSQSLEMSKVGIQAFADMHAQGFAIVASTGHAPPMDYFAMANTHPAYHKGGLAEMRDPGAAPLVNHRNEQLVQWHAYQVSGVDVARGTVTLHNVQDTTRDDITMPYGLFQNGFATVEANPVVAHPRPR